MRDYLRQNAFVNAAHSVQSSGYGQLVSQLNEAQSRDSVSENQRIASEVSANAESFATANETLQQRAEAIKATLDKERITKDDPNYHVPGISLLTAPHESNSVDATDVACPVGLQCSTFLPRPGKKENR
jgi:hypothetical protein